MDTPNRVVGFLARHTGEYREPGIDYLTPYWMLRYYTEVEHPEQGSLPTWVGPPSY